MTKERIRKSEALSTIEHDALRTYIGKQPTKLDAADAIGISRQNLDRIAAIGTCSPATAEKIRGVLNG